MSFFKKLFGGKKNASNNAVALVEEILEGIIEKGFFDISYDLDYQKDDGAEFGTISIEFSGNDEELLKEKKGLMLDSLQLILKRSLQHQFPEDRTNVLVDCGGYREESEQALIERAEDLKKIAIEQGKTVYYRALPPKERKVVHQYLSQDPRVKSRSLGDGLYKKIKIYPAKGPNASSSEEATLSEE